MNASNNNENSALAWSQIIIVILLAAGALWVQLPLRSERPLPSGAGVKTGAQQNIDTRLWQDPFETVIKTRKELPQTVTFLSRPVGATSLANAWYSTREGRPFNQEPRLKDLHEQIKDAGKDEVGILLVMVPGGNWVPADESRRRTRYAVLAGLNVKCFVPSDSEHIGYVVDHIEGEEFIFPYEWMERRTQNKQENNQECLSNRWNRVLVVWLDEDTLLKKTADRRGDTDTAKKAEPRATYGRCRQPGPITRIVEIASRLGISKGPKSPALTIIGPASSQFLVEVCQRRKCKSYKNEVEQLKQIKINWHSPWASLPDERLRRLCDDDGINRCNILPRFHQILPTDNILINHLIQELRLRHYGHGQAVVLVGQWDTEYARSLRDLLHEKISEDKTNAGAGEMTQKERFKLLTVSFLRGLDARIPETAKDKKENQDATSSVSIERPEGNSQIDYLRRLAVDLYMHQRHIGRIGAIGILGNDYYDKLLVLQALRPMFPDAIFFTTDLDAAMLHRSDNRYTRNLIVASGFGLSLNQKRQNDIPPFRDVYQTAAFLATQTAVELASKKIDLENHSTALELIQRSLQESGIYEIGRSMAIKLNAVPENICINHPAVHTSTLPMSTNHLHPPAVWKKVPVLALAFAIFWFMLMTAGLARLKHLYIWLIPIVCLIILLHIPHSTDVFDSAKGGEPIYWLQGISIWPSEIIRIIAFFLAILLIRKGIRELRSCKKHLSDEFGFVSIEGESTFAKQCLITLRRVLRGISFRTAGHSLARCARKLYRFCKNIVRPDTSHSRFSLNASDVWQAYNRKIHPAWAPLYLRFHPAFIFIIFALVFFGYFVLLTNLFNLPLPVAPARGDMAFAIDRIIITCTVLAFLALLFFALYEAFRATWLCQMLNKPTQWHFQGKNGFESNIGALPESWHDVRFISLATEPVQKILFYPFIVLSLLIVARSTLFDRWHIPIVLWAIFLTVILLIVIAAWRLRIYAERTRKLALLEIDRLIEHSVSSGRLDDVTKYKALQEQIRNLQTGVFAAFSHQPLVKATLALAGSYSGLTLLEFFNTANL